VAAGDEVLRHPLGTLKDGRAVQISTPNEPVAKNPTSRKAQGT
jgi:hypothetical protein